MAKSVNPSPLISFRVKPYLLEAIKKKLKPGQQVYGYIKDLLIRETGAIDMESPEYLKERIAELEQKLKPPTTTNSGEVKKQNTTGSGTKKTLTDKEVMAITKLSRNKIGEVKRALNENGISLIAGKYYYTRDLD